MTTRRLAPGRLALAAAAVTVGGIGTLYVHAHPLVASVSPRALSRVAPVTTPAPAATPTAAPSSRPALHPVHRVSPGALPTAPPTAPPTAVPTVQPVAAPAVPRPAVRTVVVQSGDSFSGIAVRYGTTMEAVAAANPGVDSSRLTVGQVLRLP